jgi:SAM-dependent methyltransferase
VDLAVGDSEWDYRKLDALADLTALPFSGDAFDACLNIVTLEHICEPEMALREMARTLKPGGRMLLVVPHQWEVHQEPYDFFRYTSHGMAYLLGKAGLKVDRIEPVGGFFRLMARRVLNTLQFMPAPLWPLAALVVVPPGLLLPLLDPLDRKRNFTLGYICWASKPS